MPTTPTPAQEVTMNAESFVRTFVAQFPTPNTRRALELCESGRLAWEQIVPIAAEALAKANAAVTA